MGAERAGLGEWPLFSASVNGEGVLSPPIQCKCTHIHRRANDPRLCGDPCTPLAAGSSLGGPSTLACSSPRSAARVSIAAKQMFTLFLDRLLDEKFIVLAPGCCATESVEAEGGSWPRASPALF